MKIPKNMTIYSRGGKFRGEAPDEIVPKSVAGKSSFEIPKVEKKFKKDADKSS
jgi:hypothetical protein